jgi:hypothetical protein
MKQDKDKYPVSMCSEVSHKIKGQKTGQKEVRVWVSLEGLRMREV